MSEGGMAQVVSQTRCFRNLGIYSYGRGRFRLRADDVLCNAPTDLSDLERVSEPRMKNIGLAGACYLRDARQSPKS